MFTKSNNKLQKALKKYKNNKEESIKEIATLFNIPIDENRLMDYKFTPISQTSIQLIDNSTKTKYISYYTNDVKALNYTDKKQRFNCVHTKTPTHNITRVFCINKHEKDQLIMEKIVFTDGKNKLEFERELNNDLNFQFEGPKFTIRFSPITNSTSENNHQELEKVYKKVYKEYGDIQEESFNQSHPLTFSTRDEHTSTTNGNITYRVVQKDDNYYFEGQCFESTSDIKNCFLHNNMSLNYYSTLKNRQNSSVMMFNICDNNYNKSLKICKNTFQIHIEYFDNKHGFQIINSDNEFNLPSLDKGNISNKEIQSIITELQNKWSNDEFINLVLRELNRFGEKIETKKIDILDPKSFMNMSFDEINNLVNINKKEYFELMEKPFKNIDSELKALNPQLNKLKRKKS